MFWPVYEKCEALGLPIFLHPTNTLGADRLGRYYLRNFLGKPLRDRDRGGVADVSRA